jgi:hypothetical protein
LRAPLSSALVCIISFSATVASMTVCTGLSGEDVASSQSTASPYRRATAP